MAPPVKRGTAKVAEAQASRLPADPRDEFNKEYGFPVEKQRLTDPSDRPLVGTNLSRSMRHGARQEVAKKDEPRGRG